MMEVMNPSQVCQEVMDHFKRILDPQCPYEERLQHQKVLDEFRDNNPMCVECGVRLLEESDAVTVKLGLYLLEHFIRFRWSSINCQKQIDLCQKLLQYSSNIGSSTGGSIPLYVKESIAKCIAEIVKRAWLHLWKNFIQDLFGIGDQEPHLELILLVLRRLIEDVGGGLDNQLLGQHKSQLFGEIKSEPFMLPLFNLLINVFKNCSQSGLVEAAVSTLSSVVEWVDLKYIAMEDGRLLGLLFNIVSNPQSSSELRLLTCDCLIDIVSRKGDRSSADHRKLFLLFLSKDILEWIHGVVLGQQSSNSIDEDHYLLIKRLCQLLVQIGTCQMLPLLSSEVISIPENLLDYLSVMLMFTHHPSQLLCDNSLELWLAVIGSPLTDSLLSLLPQLIQILRAKQLKVGDPELNNHPSCLYSSFDFNGSVEQSIFFSKFKGRVNNAIMASVCYVPDAANEQACALVQELVQKTYPPTQSNDDDRTSPIYLEWDAATSYIECWVNGLRKLEEGLQKAAQHGVAVIEHLLLFNPSNVLLASCHLKMLDGGIQKFIAYNEQTLVQKYMEKVIAYAVYPSDQTNKLHVTKEQKSVRMTSLRCLTTLVKQCTSLLVPATDNLLEFYLKLLTADCLLFPERSLFIETFTILCHFKKPNEQTAIMSKLLEDVVALIQSEMKHAVSALPHLIQYLGLDKDITDAVFSNDDDTSPAHFNRVKLCYCVHVLMGVLQRCTVKGRQACEAPNSSEYMVTLLDLLLPLVLEFILPLIKIFHLLWSNESKPLLSNSFQAVHSLCLYEKEIIMGTVGNTSASNQSDLDRILSQLIMAYDHCIITVGATCSTFGLATLSTVGFVESIVHCVFTHLLDTKQLRIKPIIRHIMIQMVSICPREQWQTTLMPLLAHFCRVTFNCLQTNWSSVMKKYRSSQSTDTHHEINGIEEQTLTEEVLYQQFTSYLTMQYVQLLECVCIKKQEVGNKMNDEARALKAIFGSRDHSAKTGQQLSDLAVFLLKSEIQQILLLSIVGPISWADGYSTRKCIGITSATFEKIPIIDFGEEVVFQVLDQIFLALQVHGEDETIIVQLIGLALQIYESTVDSFPAIAHKIASLPGCTPDKVMKFHSTLLSNKGSSAKNAKSAKWKRDEFKQLLMGVIGKPVGQLHKKSPVFLDLPSLVVKKSHRLRDKANPPQLATDPATDHAIDPELSLLFGGDD